MGFLMILYPILEPFWEAFGRPLGDFGGQKGAPELEYPAFAMWYLKKHLQEVPTTPPWDHLGIIWGPFGDPRGTILDHLGFILGSCWQLFGSQLPFLGASTPHYHHPNISSSHHIIISSCHRVIISSPQHLPIAWYHLVISSPNHHHISSSSF